jgi:signal transduction histidine kinase
MTFTGRIRLYLILAALLPPAMLLVVVYSQLSSEAESSSRRDMHERVRLADMLVTDYRGSVAVSMRALADAAPTRAIALRVRRPGIIPPEIDLSVSSLDFAEILDSTGTVLASSHRPGLVGENLLAKRSVSLADRLELPMATIEYDLHGRHAAFAMTVPLPYHLRLYGGAYVDSTFLERLAGFIETDISLLFVEDETELVRRTASMESLELYRQDSMFDAVLAGSQDGGFYLLAQFAHGASPVRISGLIKIAASVALISVIAAILLGLYISGRAKREIENLVSATGRIAEGDFGTPVMAYEEGEFAQLADSFSDMMVQLKRSQQRLAASETVAAWQLVGRKIAHEIKNPLTPISISADDLRRSYFERLPNFEDTLINNTRMIKSEITRLSRLLDQFVSFARMKPPEKKSVKLADLLAEVRTLYHSDSDRVHIRSHADRDRLTVDPEQIKQLLINLIKNGLESGTNSRVDVNVISEDDRIEIRVEDDGSGFAPEQLEQGVQPYLSRKPEGSGLGLVICQRIAIDHGGALELSNRPEGGARVTVTLPVE